MVQPYLWRLTDAVNLLAQPVQSPTRVAFLTLQTQHAGEDDWHRGTGFPTLSARHFAQHLHAAHVAMVHVGPKLGLDLARACFESCDF